MGTIGNLAALVTKRERNTALLFLVLVILVKIPTMGLDYHWDAVLFAKQTLFYADNGPFALPGGRILHVPLLQWTIAIPFGMFGESPFAAHLVIALFSFIGVFYTYRLASKIYNQKIGLAAAFLLLFSTAYFSMSGQFLCEVPLAALSTATVYYALMENKKAYILFASALVLTKEPGIMTVFAISLYRLISRRGIRDSVFHTLPVVAPLAWFLWSFINLGFGPNTAAFINVPIFQVLLRPLEILYTNFTWKYLWVLSIPLAIRFWKHGSSSEEKCMLLVISGYAAFFIFLPVFILPRYLLPVIPLFIIMGTKALSEVSKERFNVAVVALVILFISTYHFNGGVKGIMQDPVFSSGFYRLTSVENGEMDMGYTDMVRAQTDALNYFFDNHPNSTVLAKFPIYEEGLDGIDVGQRNWNEHGVKVVSPDNGTAQFALVESCCWSNQELDSVKNMSLEKSFVLGKYQVEIYSNA